MYTYIYMNMYIYKIRFVNIRTGRGFPLSPA